MNVFGIEVTMEMLREVSDYCMDEIWLFSVEVFEKEVKKFDLKIEAEFQERKAERERQEAIQEAKRQAK